MKIKRTKNRPGYAAAIRGIMIHAGDMDEIHIGDDRALAENWLQRLARVIEAMPRDLHEEIRSIGYASGNWPPDPYWFPGYLIWANPELITDAHERQRLSDLFLHVDAGHPGIGWMHPTIPWVNDNTEPALPKLDLGDETKLWIKPIGWGAGSFERLQSADIARADTTRVRVAELAEVGLVEGKSRRGCVLWRAKPGCA